MAWKGHLKSYLYWNWAFNLSGLMPSAPYSGNFIRKVLFTAAFVPAYALLIPQSTLQQRNERLLMLLILVAGVSTLIPRSGEYHVMGALPTLAIMSGTVGAKIITRIHWHYSLRNWLQKSSVEHVILSGMVLTVMGGWVVTGVSPYWGPRETPGYSEFVPIVERLRLSGVPGDTLFILPETDSTPQIHAMAEMLPPGLWVKGWEWYLRAPSITDRLLSEWASIPPDFIVYFPELALEQRPAIDMLLQFLYANYCPIITFSNIKHHGEAIIYRLKTGECVNTF